MLKTLGGWVQLEATQEWLLSWIINILTYKNSFQFSIIYF